MDPIEALDQIAFLLEREDEPSYRVQAFRKAATTLRALPEGDLAARSASGKLRDLPGIGEATARVIAEALAGETPAYLARLQAQPTMVPALQGESAALRAALRGDLHVHSDWSDGGSPIAEMATTAIALGHDYIVLTDHSPRLRVANGLSADRLREQLKLVAKLNAELAPFRILTGIEVDILDDGSLDQEESLLAQLDIVVASVHSKLRMERAEMTRRMVVAIANPHMDVLGHCTGRMKSGSKDRPESEFDPDYVFAACQLFDKALEINSRYERLDPPRRLIRHAMAMGCRFSIDSDAHAPGQLAWLPYGCTRAADCDLPADRVVNTLPVADLLAWASSHPTA